MNYVSTLNGQTFLGRRRKYYKNVMVYDTRPWVQPVLSSNDGNSAFVVSALSETPGNELYQAFDKNGLTYFRSQQATEAITFVTQNSIKIRSFWWNTFYSFSTGLRLSGSIDGNSFTPIGEWSNSSDEPITINVNSNGFYKYHKLEILGVNHGVVHCKQLDITADEAVGDPHEETVEVSPNEDYDYYEDKWMIFKVGK